MNSQLNCYKYHKAYNFIFIRQISLWSADIFLSLDMSGLSKFSSMTYLNYILNYSKHYWNNALFDYKVKFNKIV